MIDSPAAFSDLLEIGSGRDLAVSGLVVLGGELRLRRGEMRRGDVRRGEVLFFEFLGERLRLHLPGGPGGGLCASTSAVVVLCPIQAQLERGVLSMDRE